MPYIQINNETDFDVDEKSVRNLVEFTCGKFDVEQADISIAVLDDEKIAKLHGQFMEKESTTDVMSFDLSETDDEAKTFEIAVNAEMARRVAAKNNNPAQSELLLYILHGLLHNIGFDDLNEEDYNEMHAQENEILEKLGYGRVFGNGKFGGE
jgi:probable rRNA maturation factor